MSDLEYNQAARRGKEQYNENWGQTVAGAFKGAQSLKKSFLGQNDPQVIIQNATAHVQVIEQKLGLQPDRSATLDKRLEAIVTNFPI